MPMDTDMSFHDKDAASILKALVVGDRSGVSMELRESFNRVGVSHLLAISGDGSEQHPGIDANNRLIWGQVFLWPEADGDWRVLWDDSQVFMNNEGYQQFKASWTAHKKVQIETTFRG